MPETKPPGTKGRRSGAPLAGYLLYITNHLTHPVVEAQKASPRHHLARKLAERGQKLVVYSPLGLRKGNLLGDFLVNLRPRTIREGNTTYLFPPLLVSPTSIGTAPNLVGATIFILLYLALTRLKVSAQYSTTILVGSVGAVVRRCMKIPLVANYGDPDFVRESGLALTAFRFCESLVLTRGAASSVVYVDEVIGEYLKRRVGPDRLHFLPNGGYESGFEPPARDSEDVARLKGLLGVSDRPVVIYAGQISRTYKFEVLADAARKVIAAYPRVKFVLIGSGSASHDLQRRVVNEGVASNFLFLGEVPYDRISPYLMTADIGLQLLNDMCMGTKVMMYMVHRLPVISTGSWFGSYGRFLKNTENSILIPPRSPELSSAVLDLLGDDEARDKMGLAGWALVRPYTWDRHASDTLRLLNDAIVEN